MALIDKFSVFRQPLLARVWHGHANPRRKYKGADLPLVELQLTPVVLLEVNNVFFFDWLAQDLVGKGKARFGCFHLMY